MLISFRATSRFAHRGAIAIISAITCMTLCFCFLMQNLTPVAAKDEEKKPVSPPKGAPTLNIPYVTGGGERQSLDVYPNADPKAPLLVWIHGGGWLAGSKSPCPAQGLVSMGFSVASINYRFTQTNSFPAQIQDCKAAIRYLRAHAAELGINADLICVAGASAGGHLVSLLGLTGHIKTFDVGENLDKSSAVQAVINIVGPTEIARFDDYPNKDVIHMAEGLVGGPIKKQVETVKAASPMTYVPAITKDTPAPPFLNLYGKKDDIVPCEQGEIFDKALRDAGVETKLVVYPDGTHSLPPQSTIEMLAFLKKYVLKKE